MSNVEARATKDAPLALQACASLASRAKVPSLTFGLEVTALQIRWKAATTVGWSLSPGWPSPSDRSAGPIETQLIYGTEAIPSTGSIASRPSTCTAINAL